MTLWRVEREDAALWCRMSGRPLVEGEEFTKTRIDGHKGPVPVCKLVLPFRVIERV